MTTHETSMNPHGKDDYWDSGTAETWRLGSILSFDSRGCSVGYLVLAMENGPFIDGLPIKNGDFPWLG